MEFETSPETRIQNADALLSMSSGSSKSIPLYTEKGQALIELGRLTEAEKLFKDLNERFDKSDAGSFHLGIIMFEKKDYKNAYSYFAQARRLNSSCRGIPYWEGKILLAENKNLQQALKCFDEGVIDEPENPLYYQGQAECYLKDKSFTKALEKCIEAQEKTKCPPWGKMYLRKSILEVCAELGSSNLRKEDLNPYIALLTTITRNYPNEPKVFIEHGNALLKQWNIQDSTTNDQIAYGNAHNILNEAKESYNKALSLQSNNVLALNNLGLICQELHEFDQAIKHFSDALGECPDHKLFLFNRGKCYYMSAFQKSCIDLENKACLELENKAISDFELTFLNKKSQQGLSDGNIKMLDKILPSIITALSLTGEAKGTTYILEKEFSKKNSTEKFKNFDKRRMEIVNNILTSKNNQDTYNSQLMAIITELKQEINQVKEELSTKMTDGRKLFDQTLQSLGLDPAKSDKLRKYRDGFEKTWTNIFIACHTVCFDRFSLDTGSKTCNALSFLASLIPLYGDQISKSIEFIHGFLEEKEIKTRARIIVNVFPSLPSMTQIVGEIACKLISDDIKRSKILDGFQPSEDKPTNLFQKLQGFYEKIQGKIDTALYGDLYKTIEEQIGHEDATKLIEFTIKHEKQDVQQYLSLLLTSPETPKSSSSYHKFCVCVLSNLKPKESTFFKKKCSLCEQSSKKYWKCRNCNSKNRMCIDCHGKHVTQQPSQENL